MTASRSSSPTSPLDCDGVLIQNGNATGPIQLPNESADRFVDEFNTTYAIKQMRLEVPRANPTRTDPNRANPTRTDPKS